MKSKAFILVAASLAAVLIGCGGGGGGSHSTNTTGSTTSGVPGATQPGDSVAMVNLPKPTQPQGRLNVAYLPLQGRAIEQISALIRNIEVGLGADVFVEPLATPITFVLNGNEVQQRSTSIDVTNGVSRPFDTFYLNIDTLIDDPDPTVQGDELTFGDAVNPFVQERPFPADIRVFPSRETTVPIFLNDSMVNIVNDGVNPVSATFLPDQFTAKNPTPIQGFLSDFLSFDVSGMGSGRPTLTNGSPANRAFFSGDRFALGDASSGFFELMTEDLANPHPGQFTDPQTSGTISTPGIYRTLVFDPTDPTHTTQITEFIGVLRWAVSPSSSAGSTITNSGTFEVILMPKSSDDDTQQILLVALNGSKATNLYWGDAHLSSGTFSAFPLANLTSGSLAGEIQGTLSGFLNVNGSPVAISSPSDSQNVHYGRYSISSSLPAGFRRSGRFIVYRI